MIHFLCKYKTVGLVRPRKTIVTWHFIQKTEHKAISKLNAFMLNKMFLMIYDKLQKPWSLKLPKHNDKLYVLKIWTSMLRKKETEEKERKKTVTLFGNYSKLLALTISFQIRKEFFLTLNQKMTRETIHHNLIFMFGFVEKKKEEKW